MSEINNPFGETNHGVVQQAVKALIKDRNEHDKRITAIEDAIAKIDEAINAHPIRQAQFLNKTAEEVEAGIDNWMTTLNDSDFDHFCREEASKRLIPLKAKK